MHDTSSSSDGNMTGAVYISLLTPISLQSFSESVQAIFIGAIATACGLDAAWLNITEVKIHLSEEVARFSLRRQLESLLLVVQFGQAAPAFDMPSIEDINTQLCAVGLPTCVFYDPSAIKRSFPSCPSQLDGKRSGQVGAALVGTTIAVAVGAAATGSATSVPASIGSRFAQGVAKGGVRAVGSPGLLVSQAQMINMYGCIGGSKASSEFLDFSTNFGVSFISHDSYF